MTSTPIRTTIYQTHDGELFASKEAAQEYCRDKTYRLGMMGWTEKKLRDRKQALVSTDEPTSALVDVPAVESEPVAWLPIETAPKDGSATSTKGCAE